LITDKRNKLQEFFHYPQKLMMSARLV